MLKPAERTYIPQKLEKEIQEWWEQEKIYEKVKELRSTGPLWYFLDGPPYASGSVHLGTAWNKIIKDTILRYKTMRGFRVRRQPGWDCHGLPIEVKVEERLGIHSKKEIEERIGVAEFVSKCKEWAMEHVGIMTSQFKRLGVWMDWDSPYITFKNDYIEAVWWTLKKAHERGLMKKFMRVIHWCPRCETALAEHEVRGEYYDTRDPSIYVRFKIRGKEREYILIWTTTPWTLPANMAVCVHPNYEYAKVRVGEDFYILARELVGRVMSELGISDYHVVEILLGRELEGLSYEHPLLKEVPKQQEFVQHHRVILGEHVTLEEGTGCVHTAPGHGEEDFEIGLKYNLPVFSPVAPNGSFTQEAGKYAGIFVKEADKQIIQDISEKGVLMKAETIVHSYPYCWRCRSPLLFRATEQWFIEVKGLKKEILEKNAERVKWTPEWVATRYKNGVESVGDWCISRQRYWGVPLPVWICERCGETSVIGGLEELKSLVPEIPQDLDLHRPAVDEIIIPCSCGGKKRRAPDVLDVWFDSGVASWASLNYPKQQMEKWPSDFITEGEDQVTKWFYSQQVLSIVAFGDVPYRNVLMHGFALDEKGRKMSKSLGNVVDPEDVVKKWGADVLRFYMLSANPVWEDLKFSWEGIKTTSRLLTILWNAHVFATTYMALDGFDPTKIDSEEIQKHFLPEDRWLLSRMNSLIARVTEAMENFELHEGARALANFITEDLSRWYIKLIRNRVWIEKEDPRKTAAYVSFYQTMHVLMRLLSPFMPHITELIYRDLVKAVTPTAPESVSMLPWPKPDEAMVEKELERGMELVKSFVEAGAKLRQEAGLKLRWPIRSAILRVNEKEEKRILLSLHDLLQGQLNCKELKILGPDDPLLPLPPEKFRSTEMDGGRITIEIERDEALMAEALAREVVRRFQVMRKEMALEMEERVDAAVVGDAEDLRLLSSQKEYIKREVRISSLELGKELENSYKKEWKIEEKPLVLCLKKM